MSAVSIDGALDPDNEDDAEFMKETIGTGAAIMLIEAFSVSVEDGRINAEIVKMIAEEENCDALSLVKAIKRIKDGVNANIENTRD